jgi:hypothetical protein
VPAERVQHVTLPALVEKPLLVVLTVDLDEGTRNVGEASCGDCLIVEAGGGATT